jgi:glycosyltransferase involved in cell wall biosynthesis
MTPGVSAVIITWNEASNIRECLMSVQWASEAIVLDRFSTDDTAAIARECGARVYQEEWKGFARQKNSAIEKAQSPWILSLDADERVPPALAEEIRAVIGQPDALDGYHLPRKNFFDGQWIRHGGWHPDHVLRLFRNGSGRFQERMVHERLAIDGKSGYLRNPIEHYTYRSVSDYLARMDRYSLLAAREAADGKAGAWTSLCLRPAFTFIKMYFIRAGFLDGRAGFFLAVSYAYYTFLKYYRARAADPGK